MGLFWGAICSFVMILLLLGFRFDEEMLIIVVVCAIVSCIISARFDRFAIAFNAFLSSAVITFFLLLAVADFGEFSLLLVVAVIFASIVGVVSYKLQNYAFIFITAFSGAFLVSLGAYGIAEGRSVANVFVEFLWIGANRFAPVLIGTIILGIIGCTVQRRRIGVASSRGAYQTPGAAHITNNQQNNAWTDNKYQQASNPCSKCGVQMKEGAAFCTSCGTQVISKSQEKQDEVERFPTHNPQVPDTCSSCGVQMKIDAAFCAACSAEVVRTSQEWQDSTDQFSSHNPQAPDLCAQCGIPLRDGAAFCAGCGTQKQQPDFQ